MKIKILRSKNNQWYFRFIAKNGRILCHSETYLRLSDAKKGVMAVIKGINNRSIFEIIKVNPHEWVIR